MLALVLETTDPLVHLIEPNVKRDAPLSVAWLSGDAGRETLRLMGAADRDNKPPTLPGEQERISNFIENKSQLNWMIQVDGTVVGAIWADIVPSDELPAPAVHLMIGDPSKRGRGVGEKALKAVITYLGQLGEMHIYSRHLLSNSASAQLLQHNGFKELGGIYIDGDGMTWQNVVLDLTAQ